VSAAPHVSSIADIPSTKTAIAVVLLFKAEVHTHAATGIDENGVTSENVYNAAQQEKTK
jgi:hypothetical protein